MSIREYMSHVEPGSRKDSLGQLIAARDENGVPLSGEELVAAGMVFMIVGTTNGLKISLTNEVEIRLQLRLLGCPIIWPRIKTWRGNSTKT